MDKPPTMPSKRTPQHSQCTFPVPLLPGLALPVGSSVLLACLGTPAPSPESSCAVFTWQPGRRLFPSYHPPGDKPSQGPPQEEGAIYTPAKVLCAAFPSSHCSGLSHLQRELTLPQNLILLRVQIRRPATPDSTVPGAPEPTLPASS